MYLGKIVEIADKPSLFAEPRHPYTQALLAAIPWPDPTIKRRRVILEGDVPSPLNRRRAALPTRCPHAQDRCRSEEPVLAVDASGRATACHFWPQIAPSRTGAVLPAPPMPGSSGSRPISPTAARKDRARRLFTEQEKRPAIRPALSGRSLCVSRRN